MPLQKLADDTGFNIYVSHFPPGTSKWDTIEHRLFSHISTNWRWRPLEHLETIDFIGNMPSTAGLTVSAEANMKNYLLDEDAADAFGKIRIPRHSFHLEWNYLIRPHLNEMKFLRLIHESNLFQHPPYPPDYTTNHQ